MHEALKKAEYDIGVAYTSVLVALGQASQVEALVLGSIAQTTAKAHKDTMALMVAHVADTTDAPMPCCHPTTPATPL
jgi:hypothetical protein